MELNIGDKVRLRCIVLMRIKGDLSNGILCYGGLSRIPVSVNPTRCSFGVRKKKKEIR